MAPEYIPCSQAAQLDPRIKLPRPIVHPTLAPIIDAAPVPEKLDLGFMRDGFAAAGYTYTADTVVEAAPNLRHEEHRVPGPDGNVIILSVFPPKDMSASKVTLPLLYHIHGGGMVSGDRFGGLAQLADLIGDVECVIASVEYRLSPETRAPGPAEDCYAGLLWLCQNARRLDIDPAQVVVFGSSGGATLAAVVCLMARDRGSLAAPIKGQMLLCPMLDDRCENLSDGQFEYGIPWCGVMNRAAWDHVLGHGARGTEKVSSYHAPSRETDLSRLPSTYIDVGECEVFRDAAVAYASGLWRGGSTCELHVWPGAFHLFDGMDVPEVPLIHDAFVTKRNWLKRIWV